MLSAVVQLTKAEWLYALLNALCVKLFLALCLLQEVYFIERSLLFMGEPQMYKFCERVSICFQTYGIM